MSELGSNGTQLVVPSVQVVPASDLPNLWNFKYLHLNAGLPLLASSIFFASSLVHISMLVISKRFYMLPLIVGFLLELLAQVFKIICVASTSTSRALNYFALYSLATDLVPCLLLTSVVWMIRRMMKASDRDCFPLIVRIAIHQIMLLEVVAFWLQAYGLLVQMNPLLANFWNVGNLVTLVGSAIELLNFVWVWLSLSIILWKQTSRNGATCRNRFRFKGFATVITLSVTLMMVHTTSRFVFHLKNPQLEPFQSELLTFLLQSLPMALCAALLIVFHPYRYDGGIPDEEYSFFSPGTPMIPPLGSEMAESRSPSVNRTSNGSDPFSAVPLTTECSPIRRIHTQIRAMDHSNMNSSGYPLGSNVYHLDQSHHTFNCEKLRDDQEFGHVENVRESGTFPIDTKVHIQRSPDLNALRMRRQSSSIYDEKNPPSERVSQIDQACSPTIQHDEYCVSSYYDDGSKNSSTTWQEKTNIHEKKLSTITSFCNESMYSGQT